jgi:hypothetical protein
MAADEVEAVEETRGGHLDRLLERARGNEFFIKPAFAY